MPSTHTTLRQWLRMHPNSRVMQPDPTFADRYAKMATYETGKGASDLTRTDSLSWHDKSWVVGIVVGGTGSPVAGSPVAKAYDWNRLTSERVINDVVGSHPVVVLLAPDKQSFMAFERPTSNAVITLKNDTLRTTNRAWSLAGMAIGDGPNLKRINAYQEFWHS